MGRFRNIHQFYPQCNPTLAGSILPLDWRRSGTFPNRGSGTSNTQSTIGLVSSDFRYSPRFEWLWLEPIC